MIKYRVTLTQAERDELRAMVRKGTHSSQQIRNAYILLSVDQGQAGQPLTNEEICRVLNTSMRMIDRVKQRFVEDGLEASLQRKPGKSNRPLKIDGEIEARLIALSCSDAPAGFSKWSLRLLADKLVELEYVESISYETVRRALKKTN